MEIKEEVPKLNMTNIRGTKLIPGNKILAIVDFKGDLILFNEDEGAHKVVLDEKVKAAKYVGDKLIIFTEKSIYKYDFKGKNRLMQDYEQTKYLFEEGTKLNLVEIANFSNLLS